MRPAQPSIADDLACRPTTFAVGAHSVVLAKLPGHNGNGRWTVAVDGARSETTFESEVDAWEDGVRTADRLDRGGPAPAR